MTARDPMARLAEQMTLAEDALRQAMHAIHDTPTGTTPGDWYDRIGQLHTITARTSDLIAAVGMLVDDLPADRLRTTDGTLVQGRIDIAALDLRQAAISMRKANRHVNEAWSGMGVVAARDPEGHPS
jgi:hypothetical protein